MNKFSLTLASIVLSLASCGEQPPTLREKLDSYGPYKGGSWAIVTEHRIGYGMEGGNIQHLRGGITIVTTKEGWGAHKGGYPFTREQAIIALKNSGVE